MSGDALDALQLRVDDTALCRIHWLEHVVTLIAENRAGSLMSHIDQHFFSMLSVTADIEKNTQSLLTVTVCNQIGQVRNGIQCLAVTADCGTAILTGNGDMDHIFFTIGIQFSVDTDTGKNICYKRYGSIFCLAGFVTFERLIVAVIYVAVFLFFICYFRCYTNSSFLLAQTKKAG